MCWVSRSSERNCGCFVWICCNRLPNGDWVTHTIFIALCLRVFCGLNLGELGSDLEGIDRFRLTCCPPWPRESHHPARWWHGDRLNWGLLKIKLRPRRGKKFRKSVPTLRPANPCFAGNATGSSVFSYHLQSQSAGLYHYYVLRVGPLLLLRSVDVAVYT